MLRSLQPELPCDPTTWAWRGQPERDRTTFSHQVTLPPRSYRETQGLPCHHPCPSAKAVPCCPTAFSCIKLTSQVRCTFESQNSNFTDSLWRVGGTGKSPFSSCGLKTLEITHMALKVIQTAKSSSQKKPRGQNHKCSTHPRELLLKKVQDKA